MPDNQGATIDVAHRRIIAVIQPVLEQDGWGLAGGNALRVHGLSTRPTRDVNIFTAREGAIRRAVPKVEEALRTAGFEVERDQREADLVRDWDDYEARWIVTVNGRRILLQLATDENVGQPVIISGIGPVLDAEDVLGGKVLALVVRSAARDVIDVYQAMQRGWTPEQLIALAWRLNPDDYDAAYFTQVLPNLRKLDDFEFTQYGLDQNQIKGLRESFEQQWPAREE